MAARHAIYESARTALLAQLRTQRPPLRKSHIAREQEALEQAIALVEAKFGSEGPTPPSKPPFAAATPAAATQRAAEKPTPVNAARTEASVPPFTTSLRSFQQMCEPRKAGRGSGMRSPLFSPLSSAQSSDSRAPRS